MSEGQEQVLALEWENVCVAFMRKLKKLESYSDLLLR